MRRSVFVAIAFILSCSVVSAGSPPADVTLRIEEAEARIDTTLEDLEKQQKTEEALKRYQVEVAVLEALETDPQGPDDAERHRVLAYGYLRMGNVLRQLGRADEALEAGEKELYHARASGDDLTLARTYMNFGATLLASGETERGLDLIETSRPLFEAGDSFDFKQGLGWYWILQAELALAGLVPLEPKEQLGATDRALEILVPIENWAGVARAYALRARIHQSQGHEEAAAADLERQAEYQARDQGDSKE
jgi:tetratricopeptide (TPR) repeat protein